MASQWFYIKNEKEIGPVSSSDLLTLSKSGKLEPTDLVWKEGLEKWVSAKNIKDLFVVKDELFTLNDQNSCQSESLHNNETEGNRILQRETLESLDLTTNESEVEEHDNSMKTHLSSEENRLEERPNTDLDNTPSRSGMINSLARDTIKIGSLNTEQIRIRKINLPSLYARYGKYVFELGLHRNEFSTLFDLIERSDEIPGTTESVEFHINETSQKNRLRTLFNKVSSFFKSKKSEFHSSVQFSKLGEAVSQKFPLELTSTETGILIRDYLIRVNEISDEIQVLSKGSWWKRNLSIRNTMICFAMLIFAIVIFARKEESSDKTNAKVIDKDTSSQNKTEQQSKSKSPEKENSTLIVKDTRSQNKSVLKTDNRISAADAQIFLESYKKGKELSNNYYELKSKMTAKEYEAHKKQILEGYFLDLTMYEKCKEEYGEDNHRTQQFDARCRGWRKAFIENGVF